MEEFLYSTTGLLFTEAIISCSMSRMQKLFLPPLPACWGQIPPATFLSQLPHSSSLIIPHRDV